MLLHMIIKIMYNSVIKNFSCVILLIGELVILTKPLRCFVLKGVSVQACVPLVIN